LGHYVFLYSCSYHKWKMSGKALKCLVIVGSVRDGRFGDRAGKFVKRYLEKTNHEVEYIDPIEWELPLLKQPIYFYPDPKQAPEILHKLNEKVLNADAIIVVTAEYNRTLPPALTNLMDYLPPKSYSYRVSGIVSYSMGSFGGCIAANNARSWLTELGCLPVSHFVPIPEVHNSLDEEGNSKNPRLENSMKTLMEQIDWWGGAARAQREKHGVPKWTEKG